MAAEWSTGGNGAAWTHPASRAEWSDRTPNCAICGGPGDGDVDLHHLTRGVAVALCHTHRSERYRQQNAGHDFADALAAMWAAAGCLTNRRQAALATHTRGVQRPTPPRDRPGSYTWPHLRQEAERRFAAGEAPLRVIHDLRAANEGRGPTVPSLRTMRRWYSEARWTEPPPPGTPRRGVERVFEVVDSLRHRDDFFDVAFRGWPRTDRYDHPYHRRR